LHIDIHACLTYLANLVRNLRDLEKLIYMVVVDICSNIYRVGNIPEDVKDKASTHMPNIECPDVVKRGEKFKVRIFIKDHPNRIDHYISHIDIYFTE